MCGFGFNIRSAVKQRPAVPTGRWETHGDFKVGTRKGKFTGAEASKSKADFGKQQALPLVTLRNNRFSGKRFADCSTVYLFKLHAGLVSCNTNKI